MSAVGLPFAAAGERLLLADGAWIAELWPALGGSVAAFSWRDPGGIVHDILRRTPARSRYSPLDLACFPLVPYSNRIGNGRFRFAGREWAVPPNLAGFPVPLHGVGWLRPWTVLDHGERHCRMQLVHAPDDAWPWAFTAEQRIELAAGGMRVALQLRNDGDQAMPYGLGLHPYLVRTRGAILQASVTGVWLTDAAMRPVAHGELPPRWDLPRGCPLDGVALDNCFDGFGGAASLLQADGSVVRISGTDPAGFLVVYNPPLEAFTCVEPATHAADAFNLAARGAASVGMRRLAPGQVGTAAWQVGYEPAVTEPQSSRRR